MIFDWVLMANIIAVISPVIIMLITYIKTWGKFEVIITGLTKSVDSLQESVETLKITQEEMMGRLIRLETQLEGVLERIHVLEKYKIF